MHLNLCLSFSLWKMIKKIRKKKERLRKQRSPRATYIRERNDCLPEGIHEIVFTQGRSVIPLMCEKARPLFRWYFSPSRMHSIPRRPHKICNKSNLPCRFDTGAILDRLLRLFLSSANFGCSRDASKFVCGKPIHGSFYRPWCPWRISKSHASFLSLRAEDQAVCPNWKFFRFSSGCTHLQTLRVPSPHWYRDKLHPVLWRTRDPAADRSDLFHQSTARYPSCCSVTLYTL